MNCMKEAIIKAQLKKIEDMRKTIKDLQSDNEKLKRRIDEIEHGLFCEYENNVQLANAHLDN